MNWKVLLPFLLSFILVLSVFAGCTPQEDEAVEHVREMAESLPSVEEFSAMDAEAQLEAYHETQRAYDAYLALDADQQEQLRESLGKMESLFAHFNTLIMPIAE